MSSISATTASFETSQPIPPGERRYEPTPLSERRSIEWRRAFRAVRALIKDSERTDQAFEVISALEGMSGERLFLRFARDPRARSLLIQRRSLLDVLSDQSALATLPEGSLGRAYLDFMRGANLTPQGLVEADEERDTSSPNDEEPDRRWFFARFRDMHDLFHVMTGYGRDEAGEIANLAFTYGQFRTGGVGLLVVVGALLGTGAGGFAWLRYVASAYRRGCRARRLTAEPFEDWLARPLDDVRRDVGIEPPQIAHPAGIFVGNRADGVLVRNPG